MSKLIEYISVIAIGLWIGIGDWWNDTKKCEGEYDNE